MYSHQCETCGLVTGKSERKQAFRCTCGQLNNESLLSEEDKEFMVERPKREASAGKLRDDLRELIRKESAWTTGERDKILRFLLGRALE